MALFSTKYTSETVSLENLSYSLLPFPDCPDPLRTVSIGYERKTEYIFKEVCDMFMLKTLK